MRYALLPLFLLPISCGGGSDIVGPVTGSLEITTSTTGETTAAGYTVAIDGQAAEALGINATLIRSELAAGAHSVVLGGLPEGCTVAGDNPRGVTIRPGQTATVDFAVTCVPQVGAVRVVTTTSGSAPAGYDLLMDGLSQGQIVATGSRSFEGLPAGTHSVGLSAVPANCQLQGENPRTVAVTTGSTAEISFSLNCALPPQQTGSLNITVTTTGSSLDADGYQVAVDGGTAQPIGVQGNVLLAGLAAGSHTVLLTGLATNCTASSANPQSVSLGAGATVTVTFAVNCAATGPTTGTLRVVTATQGPAPDPDGYTYSVDGQAPQPIGTVASATIEGVAIGTHSVQLGGMAANCTLSGPNPRPVLIEAGETSEVKFSPTCVAPPVRWEPMVSNTDFHLHGVWGSSDTDVFAVGESPNGGVSSILHYDGQRWATQATIQDASLVAIWGSGPSDVYAVGRDQAILRYDGSSWTRLPGLDLGMEVSYRSVWGTSASNVYVVGADFSSGYADAIVARYDGSAWSRVTLPYEMSHRLLDVFGTSPSNIWIVGDISAPSLRRLPTEAGLSRAQIGYGFVFYFDGSTWDYSPITAEHGGLSSVWASSPTDVFVSGGAGDGTAAIYHFDGQTWSRMTLPPGAGVSELWGTSSTDVYAVGTKILHYDGTAWTDMGVAVGSRLNGIWGASPNNIFAVGQGGTILRKTR